MNKLMMSGFGVALGVLPLGCARGTSIIVEPPEPGSKDSSMPDTAAIAAIRDYAVMQATLADQPDLDIRVQHLLIAFKGTIPTPDGDKITRTRDEAEKLAADLWRRATEGEDFDALVKQYTDDEAPGVYGMTMSGTVIDEATATYPRKRMVRAFGDVGYKLKVGEFGIAVYSPAASKYGWHIIKRVK
jgi:hypothetical protein